MKNLLLSAVLLASMPALAAPADSVQVMTLSRRECIAIALADNPTVKTADLEVTRVDYSKKEILAGLFPKIDFSGNYQRSIELQTIKMDMGGQSQSFKMGSDNSWNFGFGVSMPLIAPTLWKSIKISDTQILQNLESARASRLDLVNQVNKAYYSLLLAEASYKVVKENYDIALFNADLYKKQFEAGTASEYDVLRTSVQVKNIEPELLEANIAIKQCSLQLKVLMGLPVNTEVRANTTLQEMQTEMQPHTAAIDRSLAGNTSLRSLDLQAKALKQNVDLKKMEWLPTLGASFSLFWSALSNGNALKNRRPLSIRADFFGRIPILWPQAGSGAAEGDRIPAREPREPAQCAGRSGTRQYQ